MELPQDLEDPGDLAPGRCLRPALSRPLQEGAEVAVLGVLEDQAVERALVRDAQRKGSKTRMARGWRSRSWPK